MLTFSNQPSRPGEFHSEPFTDPCLTVSGHTARATHEGCRPPSKPAGSCCRQLTHYGSDVDSLPASLDGSYSASTLLPGSPPLGVASLLSPSWFSPLVASPFASMPRFSCSIRPPLLGSGHLHAGCRSVRKQVPPELFPRSSNYRGFNIVLVIFDTAVVRFRSSPSKSPDPNFASGPFPSPFTTTLLRGQQRKLV